ncbi:hypothetical protein [Paradevosia shaoguanensis]|uniref:hypothetical protein n=1 Tax=Paradevosia shaoguanensis TaxID=1335043 RepID=UPI003C765189
MRESTAAAVYPGDVREDTPFIEAADKAAFFRSNEGKALRLQKALRKLCTRRKECGELGLLAGWYRACAYVSALLDKTPSAETVESRARLLGLPIEPALLRPVAREVIAAAEVYAEARAPRIIGELVRLTTQERTELKIRCVDAFDELAIDRKKRLARESAARRRAMQGAVPHAQSARAQARAAGISRATFYRHRAQQKTDGDVVRHFHRVAISSSLNLQRDESVSPIDERDESVSSRDEGIA